MVSIAELEDTKGGTRSGVLLVLLGREGSLPAASIGLSNTVWEMPPGELRTSLCTVQCMIVGRNLNEASKLSWVGYSSRWPNCADWRWKLSFGLEIMKTSKLVPSAHFSTLI